MYSRGDMYADMPDTHSSYKGSKNGKGRFVFNRHINPLGQIYGKYRPEHILVEFLDKGVYDVALAAPPKDFQHIGNIGQGGILWFFFAFHFSSSTKKRAFHAEMLARNAV